MIAAYVTPAGGTGLTTRTTAGAAATTVAGTPGIVPQWFRLVRKGNTVTGYVSADGTAWKTLGQATFTLPGTVYVGSFATSANPSTAGVATFSHVRVNGVELEADRERD
jgi:regulation of enolase protein 1 (concanavalin A-like superfamily)